MRALPRTSGPVCPVAIAETGTAPRRAANSMTARRVISYEGTRTSATYRERNTQAIGGCRPRCPALLLRFVGQAGVCGTRVQGGVLGGVPGIGCSDQYAVICPGYVCQPGQGWQSGIS